MSLRVCLPVALAATLAFCQVTPLLLSLSLCLWLTDDASTPLHIQQCCVHVSGGCGGMQVVRRSLTEPPPAVFTVQLKCHSHVTTADEVQKTLKGIDEVSFSLYTMCSNTQSGSLQCPGLSTGSNSLMLLVLTPACCGHHTNQVCPRFARH